MSTFEIVRAWKDAEYRQSLSAEEQALLPEHPAGSIELADEELPQVNGGTTILMSCTFDDFCTQLSDLLPICITTITPLTV
jgi:mersacidin/lichenicidin family type 2 lantibiotic